MRSVNRDRAIVFGIVAVIVVVAIAGHAIGPATLVLIAVAIPSIILHEVSHGVVALWFGDDTARRAGRLTLNPVAHVDVFGTLLLPAILALSGFGVFGYAKPVPINPARMRHPRNDSLVVSLAGPATNVVLAVAAGLWLRHERAALLANFVVRQNAGLDQLPLRLQIPLAFGIINVVLAVFNLIPIPPLDGSAVVERIMPTAWRRGWEQIRRFGVIILVVLALARPDLLARLFQPALRLWQRTT